MERKIVEAIPIRDQVVEIIREMILNGELEPEQQLSERQLGRELHVSTTPIKEAFRILQSEGLLYSVPRKGSFVSEFSKRNVLQTVYIRGVLEGVAAYFACQNITDHEIDIMEKALTRSGKFILKKKVDSEVVRGIETQNALFHSTLRNASQNSHLIGLIENMRSIDKTIRQVSLRRDTEEQIRAHKEHLGIFEAMKARNGKEAEALMNAHVRRVGNYVVENNKE